MLHVLRELERRGYSTTWGIFSAAEVGFDHERARVFILGAHPNHEGKLHSQLNDEMEMLQEFCKEAQHSHHSSGREKDGTPHRADRLRLLGNGVVPATAARAFIELSKRFRCSDRYSSAVTFGPAQQ